MYEKQKLDEKIKNEKTEEAKVTEEQGSSDKEEVIPYSNAPEDKQTITKNLLKIIKKLKPGSAITDSETSYFYYYCKEVVQLCISGATPYKFFELIKELDKASTSINVTAGVLKISTKNRINTDFKIPLFLHFIWVGSRYASVKSIKVIANWALNNPDRKVFLWVDILSAQKQNKELLYSHYHEGFTKAFIDLKGTCSEEDFHNIIIVNISALDNPATHHYMRFVRHEIDRLDPNYGTAADLLRYLILRWLAGGYFDIDIDAVEKKLSDFESLDHLKEHVFFVDHLTQKQNKDVTSEELKEFKVARNARIGNDSIIATINNPISIKLTEAILENYTIKGLTTSIRLNNPTQQGITEDHVRIKLAYDAKDIEFYAICITGPEFFRHMLCGNDFNNVEILPLRSDKYMMVSPLENQKTWAIIRINRVSTEEEALARTMDSIDFELEQFGILRLEDHIMNLHKSLHGDEENFDKELVQRFLDRLQKLDLSKVEIAQCLFKYPNTLDFYSRHPRLCTKAIVFGNNRDEILYIFKLIVNYDKLLQMLGMFKHSASKLEVDQLEFIVQNIKTLMTFLEGFKKAHQNKLPPWLQSEASSFFDKILLYIDRINGKLDKNKQLPNQKIYDFLKLIGLTKQKPEVDIDYGALDIFDSSPTV
jgi:hypothetical protein